jgi:hypothetical protein
MLDKNPPNYKTAVYQQRNSFEILHIYITIEDNLIDQNLRNNMESKKF